MSYAVGVTSWMFQTGDCCVEFYICQPIWNHKIHSQLWISVGLVLFLTLCNDLRFSLCCTQEKPWNIPNQRQLHFYTPWIFSRMVYNIWVVYLHIRSRNIPHLKFINIVTLWWWQNKINLGLTWYKIQSNKVKLKSKCFIAIHEKQDWRPFGLICPTHLRITLRNIDLILVQQVSRVQRPSRHITQWCHYYIERPWHFLDTIMRRHYCAIGLMGKICVPLYYNMCTAED